MKRWFGGIIALILSYFIMEYWIDVNEVFAFGILGGFLVSGIYFDWINPRQR